MDWHKSGQMVHGADITSLTNLNLVRTVEDKDGVIWAGAEINPMPNGWSLFRIDHGKASPYNLPEFVGLGFTPLFADKEGRLWADSEKGIWRILPGLPKLFQKQTKRSSAMSEDIIRLIALRGGRTNLKIPADGTSEDYLGKIDGHQINTMLRDNEGGLWIGTYGQGIVHLHDGRIDHFSSVRRSFFRHCRVDIPGQGRQCVGDDSR